MTLADLIKEKELTIERLQREIARLHSSLHTIYLHNKCNRPLWTFDDKKGPDVSIDGLTRGICLYCKGYEDASQTTPEQSKPVHDKALPLNDGPRKRGRKNVMKAFLERNPDFIKSPRA